MARHRGGGAGLRHREPDPGGDHGQRGAPGGRPLLGAAPRGLRRHHAVQLSGHDPALDVPAGGGLRQRLRAQALRAGSSHPHAPGRAVYRGGGPQGHSVGGAWRRRAGGCAAGPSRCQGSQFRGLGPGRWSRLSQHHFPAQAGPVFCRRQEPHGDHAGCQQGTGTRQPGGSRGRRRRSALHGHQRGGVRGERPGVDPRARRRVRQGETRRLARSRGGLWPPHQPGGESQGGGAYRGGDCRGGRVPAGRPFLRRARLPGGQLGGADPVSRRDPRDAHLPGGDLRARAGLPRGGEPG